MSSQEQNIEKPIPHPETLKMAAKWATLYDKPIMLDYYVTSLCGKCALKKTSDNDKILYKSNDEYTSALVKVVEIAKSKNEQGIGDLICASENSIYLVSNLLLRQQPQTNA